MGVTGNVTEGILSMKCSVAEFAAKHGVDYATANGLVKFLEAKGLATLGEKRKAAGSGKGKPTNIYTLPTSVTLVLDPDAAVKQPVPLPEAA